VHRCAEYCDAIDVNVYVYVYAHIYTYPHDALQTPFTTNLKCTDLRGTVAQTTSYIYIFMYTYNTYICTHIYMYINTHIRCANDVTHVNALRRFVNPELFFLKSTNLKCTDVTSHLVYKLNEDVTHVVV